jgi:putative glycosyltransferase
MSKPELSIVTTLYRSAPFLADFLARATSVAEAVSTSHEIVLVDDGSPDGSLALAIQAMQTDERVRVIELSRNFGHHAAILAGLTHARADRVFFVDSDLEEPPELLLRFALAMDETDAEVVYGFHDQRVGSRMRQLASGFFWRVFNLMSETSTQQNICHVRLMRRAYVDILLAMPERNLFLGGLYPWPGFRQTPLRVERSINREVSTYNLRRRLSLAVRSIIAFSARPLHAVFALGAGIALISLIVALTTLGLRMLWGEAMLVGYASIMISIWFLGGLTIMSLGIIGLYISQIYVESKGRPRWVVRCVHENVTRAGETA